MPILMALVSVTAQMIALVAVTGVVAPAVNKQTANAVMASALLHTIACGQGAKSCQPAPSPVLAGDSKQSEKIEVPRGASQCPNSGAGAACGQAGAASLAGTPAQPAGAAACPADPGKLVLAVPGACSDAPPDPIPGMADGAPRLEPDNPTVLLSVDKSVLGAGATTLLEARSNMSMTGTPWALEIFDMTGRSLIGACTQSAVCSVAYTGGTGRRTFVAYVMTPGQKVPDGTAAASSNAVDSRWLGVGVAVGTPSIVSPGSPITFTASASEDVGKIGYRIELHDAASGQRLTFCTQGTTCSTAVVEPHAATRSVVAQLVAQAPATHATSLSLSTTSGIVSGTWLGVDLASSTTAGMSGGPVALTATANTDLRNTPWSIYIQNEAGQVIGQPCNTSTCSASVTVGAHDNSQYRAVIGRFVSDAAPAGPTGSVRQANPAPPKAHFELGATSQLERPRRLLWGVDSCKSFSDGLLAQVSSTLGTPSFWGRYLPNTDNCPGLSGAEISAAHARHMGILPIYNDYDCSAVSTNATGSAYGLAAVQWAWNDIIPQGTAIAIDIEPPGDACPGAASVDKGFIEGWFDQLTRAGYVPAFYGNTSGGSAFAAAWCAAVAERADIANRSFVWSFEPSLIIGHAAQYAPTWAPNGPGCAGHYVAWQYSLSAGSAPDVDVDEATSEFPFWWP